MNSMNKPYILIVDDDTALFEALPQALSLRIDSRGSGYVGLGPGSA